MAENCLNCNHFGFKGLKKWCKAHDREIRKPTGKCDRWVDRMKKDRPRRHD